MLLMLACMLLLAACARVEDAASKGIGESPASAVRAPAELTLEDGVDYSCSTSADCAIKDVGNCCGYFPACVNAASETFPERVKAECAASGMSSVCGFPSLSGCECIEGRCSGVTGANATLIPPEATPADQD